MNCEKETQPQLSAMADNFGCRFLYPYTHLISGFLLLVSSLICLSVYRFPDRFPISYEPYKKCDNIIRMGWAI